MTKLATSTFIAAILIITPAFSFVESRPNANSATSNAICISSMALLWLTSLIITYKNPTVKNSAAISLGASWGFLIACIISCIIGHSGYTLLPVPFLVGPILMFLLTTPALLANHIITRRNTVS